MPRPRTVPDDDILRATGAVIGEVGPAALTLARVGERVGLAPATLSQRFGSRRGLLLAFAHHDVEVTPSRIRGAAEDTPVLPRLIGALVEGLGEIRSTAQYANHLSFLLMDLSDPDFSAVLHHYSRNVVDALEEVIRAAQRNGELAPRVDPAQLASLLYTVYNGALLTWGMGARSPIGAHLATQLEAFLDPYRNGGRTDVRAAPVPTSRN